MVNPHAPDLLAALKLLKHNEPTTELVIHKTKQGSYTFSLRVKGAVQCEEEPAQNVCERACQLANVLPLEVPMPFRRGMSIFEVLQRERLQQAGIQVMPRS